MWNCITCTSQIVYMNIKIVLAFLFHFQQANCHPVIPISIHFPSLCCTPAARQVKYVLQRIQDSTKTNWLSPGEKPDFCRSNFRSLLLPFSCWHTQLCSSSSGLDIHIMITVLYYQRFLNYTIPIGPVSQCTITICNYCLKGLSQGVAEKPADVLVTAY